MPQVQMKTREFYLGMFNQEIVDNPDNPEQKALKVNAPPNEIVNLITIELLCDIRDLALASAMAAGAAQKDGTSGIILARPGMT